jgi:hypothetical protein
VWTWTSSPPGVKSGKSRNIESAIECDRSGDISDNGREKIKISMAEDTTQGTLRRRYCVSKV